MAMVIRPLLLTIECLTLELSSGDYPIKVLNCNVFKVLQKLVNYHYGRKVV